MRIGVSNSVWRLACARNTAAVGPVEDDNMRGEISLQTMQCGAQSFASQTTASSAKVHTRESSYFDVSSLVSRKHWTELVARETMLFIQEGTLVHRLELLSKGCLWVFPRPRGKAAGDITEQTRRSIPHISGLEAPLNIVAHHLATLPTDLLSH